MVFAPPCLAGRVVSRASSSALPRENGLDVKKIQGENAPNIGPSALSTSPLRNVTVFRNARTIQFFSGIVRGV